MLIESSFRAFAPSKGFIVVDGVNGAGKGTLLAKLIDYLQSKGKQVVATREPGGTGLGTHLRQVLLEERAGKPAPLTEVLLFAADRAEHVDKKIRPALAAGKIVLCDRYYYSSLAFQGYGRMLDYGKIFDVNMVAIDGMLPDLTLLLDVCPEEGLRRAKRRSEVAAKDAGGSDAFEKETLAFHQRIREGFLRIARELPEPFLIVDASMGPEEVFKFVLPVVDACLVTH